MSARVDSPGRTAVGPDVVLAAAVSALGGEERPGQVRMVAEVSATLERGEHLLVQAGTGTGKSLGYLVPAVLLGRRVVVATATLALQSQLVERDLPLLLAASAPVLAKAGRRRPSFSVLKGRSNYACLHRVREGVPDDQGTLADVVPSGAVGRGVVALRRWAEEQAEAGGAGDRDEAPPHADRAWAQVSVSARECLGAQRCPYGGECFAERARDEALAADIVVTNHVLLAIDAMEPVEVLPEHDVVVVDEAHELARRVTGAASAELSAAVAERVARRARPFVDTTDPDRLGEAAEALRGALETATAGRVEVLDGPLGDAVVAVRDAARAAYGVVGSSATAEPTDGPPADDAPRRQVRAAVFELLEVADRMAAMSPADVTWVADRDGGTGRQLRTAPLSVAGLLRDRLFADRTVVLTSATLTVGGDFTALARSVGLRLVDQVSPAPKAERESPPATTEGAAGLVGEPGPAGQTGTPELAGSPVPGLPWRGVDVGSPFDYRRQAICYVARGLPTPGRDGIAAATLDEVAALVEAAGGRTLGLFSSRRAAERAAALVRERLPQLSVLCQGEAHLADLARRFVAEPATSLFGTLSLWQGLDVPGPACQLVVIDRIPFPRPDDPLMSARQRAVDEAGGNGFLTVAATHAGLLLAQGSGRLIRGPRDRGVVAVLDSRLATARYGGYLRASLPPMWPTSNRDTVLAALRRLAAAADAQT